MKNVKPVQIGQVVKVLMGRDRGCFAIVVGLEGERFAYIADGIYRRMDKPKKKNLRHIEPVDYTDEEIRQAILSNGRVNNAKIRSALEKFNNAFTEAQMKGEK